MKYIFAFVSIFLTPYIMFDITNLYQIPYLVAFSYAQFLGFGCIIVILFKALIMILDEVSTNENIQIISLLTNLLVWGIAYLTHWVLVNWMHIKIY